MNTNPHRMYQDTRPAHPRQNRVTDRGLCNPRELNRNFMPKLFVYMSGQEWATSAIIGAAIAGLLLPYYSEISLWVGIALIIFAMSIFNMVMASRYCIPLFQLATMICATQLVFAPWLSHYYPYDPQFGYNIDDNIGTLLAYTCPLTLVFALGFLVAVSRVKAIRPEPPVFPSDEARQRLLREINFLFIIGVAAYFLRVSIRMPSSINFIVVLCSHLGMFAVLAKILLLAPHWKSSATILYGAMVLRAITNGVFHEALLWGASITLVLGIRHQKRLKLWLIIAFALLGVLILQNIKTEYRKSAWIGEARTNFDRVILFGTCAVDVISTPSKLLDDEQISRTVLRLNQGWIVNKVLLWVPDREPFANGETLRRQFVATLLPRFILKKKFSVGGKEYFERFTGQKLAQASMGLGYSGEMYANFGYWGGLIGCFFYAALLGLGFYWMQRMANRSALWWAWLPFIANVAVKAEDSIGMVLNWVVKAAIVMFAVSWFLPGLKDTLFTHKTVRQGPDSPAEPTHGLRRPHQKW